jgi:hypothetical protein
MKSIQKAFAVIHASIAVAFTGVALLLLAVAARIFWQAVTGDLGGETIQLAIESIGLLAIAVVAIQISQTIMEEEVIREVHISGPTRVRRYLSRFLAVVVIALAIESLLGTFKALHDHPEMFPYPAATAVAAGILLAGWGLFIRFNREAEELEPEAMEEAKGEDHKVQ